MSLDPGIRSVGHLLLLLLLWTRARTDAVTVGDAAVLPCPCPPARPPFLSWQKDERMVTSVEKKTAKPAAEYENRTELRWTGDSCFLKILNVSLSDQGTYRCYYQSRPLRYEDVHLEVTDRHTRDGPVVQSPAVTSSVCVLLVLVFAAVAVCVGITCKRKRNRGTVIETRTGSFSSCQ